MSRFDLPDPDLSESDVCGNCKMPSVDDEGEPVCQEAPGFCSKACQDQYMVCVGEQAAAEHAQLEYESYLASGQGQAAAIADPLAGLCKHEHMTLAGGFTRADGLVVLDFLCDDCGTSGSTSVSFDEVLW